MDTTRQEPATVTDSPNPLLRTIRAALRSPIALTYLAGCAILLGWALVVTANHGPDASLAGVWPLLATAPVSLILLVLPDHPSMLFLAIGVGALVNTVLIGWCHHSLRRGRSGSAT